MEVQDLPVLKRDERGTIYDCGKMKLIIRKKDTISADHIHDTHEVLFLLDGEVEITIGNETRVVKAPVKIEVPPNTYHKILALTDIKLLENK